jgi:type IX secretion system PorP/SprF family membrane protein
MRKENLKIATLLIGLFISFYSYSQQDAQYTQYMYNMSIINPAYATNQPGNLELGGLYRSQWVGAVGGPTTGTFFLHSPLSKRVEVGTSIIHDEIGGVVKETNFFVDFAYLLKLGVNQHISFGIKAGGNFYATNFDGFVLNDATPDPSFENNVSKIFPNIGVGTFYFSKNYYLGLSMPNLIRSKHLDEKNGIYNIGTEEIHYFLTGGYVFNINDNLKLKPAFMAKSAPSAPASLSITGNVLMYNRVEFGIGYQLEDSFSGLVNFTVTPSLRIGYAYDKTISNLGPFNSGSHEVILLYNFKNKLFKNNENGYDKSPRFF